MLVTIMHDRLLPDQTFEMHQDAGLKAYKILIRNHRGPFSDSANVRCGSATICYYLCQLQKRSGVPTNAIIMAGQRVKRFGLQIVRACKQLIIQYVINARFRLFYVGMAVNIDRRTITFHSSMLAYLSVL